MADKLKRASEYKSEQVALVRSTCLYVATKLGDLMEDLVVVGGLVPSLLIDQSALPEEASAHVGTADLDVGLKLALLDEGRYRTLTGRLRDARFMPDQTDDGRLTRQRWRTTGVGPVTVDFLIPPSRPNDQGGKLRDIEQDFAAIIAPGLNLAFQDRRRVRIEGKTVFGERAAREIWVCGPGAFVVLKALAFLGRGENKDAYDIYYLIRNFGAGIEDVATCLQPLLIGPRCHELRIDDTEAKREFRIIYYTGLSAIAILEVFAKTTMTTPATPNRVLYSRHWRACCRNAPTGRPELGGRRPDASSHKENVSVYGSGVSRRRPGDWRAIMRCLCDSGRGWQSRSVKLYPILSSGRSAPRSCSPWR